MTQLPPYRISLMAPTIILRHRKENLKKCSLTPLHGHPCLQFFLYPQQIDQLPIAPGTIVLAMGAPVLRADPSEAPLLLIDGTWRLAEVMDRQVMQRFGERVQLASLPPCRTAYPRRQTDCADPEQGLASVEALYLAHLLLGRSLEGLLDHYHWREEFLSLNQDLWERIASEQANRLQ